MKKSRRQSCVPNFLMYCIVLASEHGGGGYRGGEGNNFIDEVKHVLGYTIYIDLDYVIAKW